MASNLTIDYQITGVNLYALSLSDAGTIWNGSALVTFNGANWATYALALTELGTSGIYQVAVPALPAGIYSISIRVRAGASAATTDALAGSGTLLWDGTATSVLPTNAQLATAHGAGMWGAAVGGGALTLTYTLTSSVDASPIEGATVELYAEIGMTTIIDSQVTNAFGVCTFSNLVAGTYYLKRIKSGWSFTNPDTEVVA